MTATNNATNPPQAANAVIVGSTDLICRELFKEAVNAGDSLKDCKEKGDDEGRIEFRGQRDAYLHAIEIVKRHIEKLSD